MGYLPRLTEALIRQNATSQSFERGMSYYRNGAVRSVVRRGQEITAEVEGSEYEPYRVRIVFDDAGIRKATCTCPYDWGGWCKHIVATLLTCIHSPETIEERPPLETLLAELDRDKLQALVLELVKSRPELEETVEMYVGTPEDQSETDQTRKSLPRRTLPDASAFRNQVRRILHSLDHMRRSEAYWHVGEVVGKVSRLVDRAWDFIENGDGRSALVILEAITDEYMKDWVILDDSDGEASGFFMDLGEAWTEALLTADLSPEKRQMWADRLDAWQDELSDYGIEEAFLAARDAVSQEWDTSSAQRDEAAEESPNGEQPIYTHSLIEARLNVLERQGRYQDYLRLAKAEGRMQRYLTMLAKLGRIQEAITEGLEHMKTTGEALALAEALREQGAVQEALRIAEHGLTLEGGRTTLARWLRDAAIGVGQNERALDAALVAFRERPGLPDYQIIRELAGERWPELRAELLDRLRQQDSSPEDRIAIFLHEGLVDEAIAVVEKEGSFYWLVEKVIDAAIEARPEWAIRTARQQAESIMNRGKAQHYHHAVRWLEKARSAYRAAGREAEWREYLESLIRTHWRKYKLVPMLEALRR